MKILKRPSAAVLRSSDPTEYVSTAVGTMIDECLSRERTRLEALYRARHDALLRAVSDVLNHSLERIVVTAAKRELHHLMEAFVSLTLNSPEMATFPTSNEDISKSTKEAFSSTFEKLLLPQFQKSIANMLKSVSETVESQIDVRIVEPSAKVASSLESASGSLRSAQADIREMRATSSDSGALAQVQAALDEGNIVRALCLSVGKSVEVQTKALAGLLNSDVRPEDAFLDINLPVIDLVNLAALVTNDLFDHTELRIQWLYEIVMSMDNVEETAAFFENQDVGKIRGLFTDVIERLSSFQTSGSPFPQETKHAKVLKHVLRTHLNALPQ